MPTSSEARQKRNRPPALSPGGLNAGGERAKRILAVDDSQTCRRKLENDLRTAGFEVILASSGEEALEQLAKNQVDCIFLDLILPGLSGQETCRRIKASSVWREIPVIMLTSVESREAVVESINLGADDYIAKSSDYTVLRARLELQLRRRQFEEENQRIREELLHRKIEGAEAAAARRLAETRAALMGDLERKNAELARANSELEYAKEQAERASRLKSKFLASMSHELRTPLNAIIGFSEVLLQQEITGPLDARQNEFIEHILSSGQHLLSLIDELLNLSQIETGKIKLSREWVTPAGIIEAVQNVMRPISQKHGVALQVSIPGDLPELYVDCVRIKQVLYNLLSNAIKFSHHGGTVSLTARVLGDHLELAVEDRGIGIAVKDLARLFQEFERIEPNAGSGPSGTGLGLVITKRLVALHGGSIDVRSELNQGTTVTVRLPINADEREG